MSTPINFNMSKREKFNQVDLLSNEMLEYVHTNPLYIQCLLHIKAYRDYHKEEKEEMKERVEVLDERYSRYNMLINYLQISIIFLSALSSFFQAGNQIIGMSENAITFMALCISSWTALTLSIAKYYKLDDQKENMSSLRHACAEFMAELGAREDRLNTLCSQEIWCGAPTAPVPPAVTAWENERDDMYNALKHLIQKKQALVNSFEYIMDTHEAKNLIMAAKKKRLTYKFNKLKLDNEFLEYSKLKQEQLKQKYQISGREDGIYEHDNYNPDLIDRRKCSYNTIINSSLSKDNKYSKRGDFLQDHGPSPLEKTFLFNEKKNSDILSSPVPQPPPSSPTLNTSSNLEIDVRK